MMWKGFVEKIATTLPTMPPAPWSVKTTTDNQRVLLDANQNPILMLAPMEMYEEPTCPICLNLKEACDHNEPDPERVAEWIRQYQILEMLCEIRNHCETWFNAMVEAGINDIRLPKKPKKEAPAFQFVMPEPKTFNVKEILGDVPTT